MGAHTVMMLTLAILVIAWAFVALAVVVLCVAAHRGDVNDRRRTAHLALSRSRAGHGRARLSA